MINKKTQVCQKCGNDKNIDEFYYHRTRKHYMNTCKLCNNETSRTNQHRYRKDKPINFVLSARAASIRRDKKHKVPVADNLTELLMNQWVIQDGKCYYTELSLDYLGSYVNNHNYLTVDRIIPELGYVEGNVVLCCSIINKIKTDLSIKELKYYVSLLKD